MIALISSANACLRKQVAIAFGNSCHFYKAAVRELAYSRPWEPFLVGSNRLSYYCQVSVPGIFICMRIDAIQVRERTENSYLVQECLRRLFLFVYMFCFQK